MVVLAVTWMAKVGREAEVVAIFEKLSAESRKEPGCLMYQVHKHKTDPRRFSLLFKSGMHVYSLFTQLWTLNDEGVLLTELAIVDMTLTASLVVIVFLSGYANFVAPVIMRADDGRPHWIAEIDFSELKLKLMASIVAISAIKLLEGFMDISNESDRQLFWLVVIHLTFVASTLLLAVSDRFGHRTRLTPDHDVEGV